MSRKVCGVTTGARVPSKMSLGQLDGTRMVAMVTQPIGEERGRLEDDSHADTCLLGKGWRLVHDRGHSCQVEGFSADVGTLSLPIVDAVTVAETTEGKEVLIQINQALWKPDEDHSLLSSFQCRYRGTRLDNVPMSQQNAYLNAEPRENVYTIAGKEWGALEGRVVVIVRSLYGLKSAGAAWAAALRQVMRDLGFFPCRADGDVWMRASVDTTFGGERSLGATNDQGQPDGHWYYEYVLIHTDDILSISKHPGKIMEAIGSVYKLKEDRKTRLQWDDPDLYLGSKVRKYRTPEDEEDLDCPLGYCWSTSGDDYVKSVIEDIQAKLGKDGRQLNANQCSPVSSGYRPELDTSPELVGDSISDFQEVIGCLRWAIELGRGDIATEVALLSRHLALPRRGHLEQAYNVVAYLKKHPYSKLVMDPTPQGHKDRYAKRFNTDADWFEFYGDVKEEIPLDAPKPMGKPVEITAYCDADHAGDKLTRRSHTGILIFLMSAPILWYSKRQATIESSTFGSEIVALRTCLELIKELRYKLRMMGVPIDGPAVVWCDNQSVAKGAAVPEAKLNKKHLGICYHAVREASAAKIWQVGFIKGEHNIADCLTKILSGTVLEKQVKQWMYRK